MIRDRSGALATSRSPIFPNRSMELNKFVTQLKQQGFHSFLVGMAILFAQTGVALGLSFHVQPSKISFEIQPGKTALTVVTVQNLRFDESANFTLEVLDIVQRNNGNMGLVETEASEGQSTPPESCRPWVSLSESSFTLGPGMSKEVEIRFGVPGTASGDKYAAITVASMPKSGENQVAINVRTAVIIEVSVQGRIPKRAVEVKDLGMEFETEKDGNSGRDLIWAQVENTGNVASYFSGTLTVFRKQDERFVRIARLPLNEVKSIPSSDFRIAL